MSESKLDLNPLEYREVPIPENEPIPDLNKIPSVRIPNPDVEPTEEDLHDDRMSELGKDQNF
jgi:hypothetical protein